MRRHWPIVLGVCVSVNGVLAVAANNETTAGASPGLEEIVVTAQKREERAIDVPMSVTVVNAEDLAVQNLDQLKDYYSRIPGLQINGNTTQDISIRGITTGGGLSPTIAITIDDVKFGASTQTGLSDGHFPDFDPAMLDSIEVLRGPQGTLYGASSLGGLIKYVTRQPDTNNFSGRVETGVETTDGGGMGWSTRGEVNIPIVSDMVGLRVSAFKRVDPAYLDNINPDNGVLSYNVNSVNTYGGHAALLVKPMDGVSILLSALEQKRNAQFSDGGPVVNENAAGYPDFNSGANGNLTTLSLGPTSDIGDQQLYSAKIDADLPASLHVTSITAWQKSDGTNFDDVSNVFGFLQSVYGPGSTSIADVAGTEKFSQELRLSGKIEQFDWRLGLYYTKESSNTNQALNFTGPGVSVVPFASLGPNTYRERAAFADATYHFTPQFEVSAGVRWAHNEQWAGGSTVVDPAAVVFFGPSSSGGTPETSEDSSTTWQVTPEYHITSDLMAYVRVATGYRPGGFNNTIAGVPPSFAPDTTTNYELGLKGIVSEHSLSYDIALFDIEWKDIQLQDTSAANEFTYITNGGRAHSRGLEAEISWKPYTGLTVGANMTLLDAVLAQTIPSSPGIDTLIGNAGDRLPGSARFTSNLSIQQDFPIANGIVGFVGGNWSYIGTRDSAFQLFVPSADDPTVNTSTPRFTIPSYSLVDLRTGARWDGWRASVFLRNAFNKFGVLYADNRNGTSVTTAEYLTPRTVGLTLSKDF
jgi:iron complex outermembrane receptor protein